MKPLNLQLLLFGAIGVLASNVSGATNTYTQRLSFHADSVTFTLQQHNNAVYCEPSYPGMSPMDNPGAPSLPSTSVTFQIPLGATNITVTAIGSNDVELYCPYLIMPLQEDQLASDSTGPQFTLPDPSIYENYASYPLSGATIEHDGLSMGSNRLLTVVVNPFLYKIVKDELHIYETVDIQVSYDVSSDILSVCPQRPIARQTLLSPSGSGTAADEIVASTRNAILLDSTLVDRLTPIPELYPYIESAPVPEAFFYTIITSDQLKSSFQRLAALKRHKGINAGIVTMEDIKHCGAFNRGDSISGIRDDAGILRAYLTYAFEHYGTSYVLLGGYKTHVPIREGYTESEYAGSDWYFADLNGDWDVDRSGPPYGRTSDNLDYEPDLFVGRLLCTTAQEVEDYIDKVEWYELNPGDGDPQYLDNAFGGYSNSFTYQRASMTDRLSSLVPNVTSICQNGICPSGRELVDSLNAHGPFGICSFHYHGNPSGVMVVQDDNVTYGLLGVEGVNYYHTSESGNGLNNIMNHKCPYIAYSLSCHLAPYGIYNEYELDWNFGQSVVLGHNYGGVAFLGNSLHGYVESSYRLELKFLEIMQDGDLTLGQVEAFSKAKSYYKSIYHHLAMVHNLHGDPTIHPWRGAPAARPTISAQVSDSNVTINVTDSTTPTHRAGILPLNGEAPTMVDLGPLTTYTHPTAGNVAIMVYGDTSLPQLYDLRIQDETYNNTNYIYVKSLTIGANVNNNRSSGNVVFANGSDFTFFANDYAELHPGTIIEAGAHLTINTPGDVILDNVTLEPGAKLTVNCNDCHVTSIQAPLGAIISINKYTHDFHL